MPDVQHAFGAGDVFLLAMFGQVGERRPDVFLEFGSKLAPVVIALLQDVIAQPNVLDQLLRSCRVELLVPDTDRRFVVSLV